VKWQLGKGSRESSQARFPGVTEPGLQADSPLTYAADLRQNTGQQAAGALSGHMPALEDDQV